MFYIVKKNNIKKSIVFLWHLVYYKIVADYILLFQLEDFMDFGQAVAKMRLDCRLARTAWISKDEFVKLQVPDGQSKMTLSYIWIYTDGTNRVPWIPAYADLLASDWMVV